ncbi:hypothetical protein ACEZDB_16410 [Streptacidiphilus sp. N1-3]|uniref:Uncharacterized protein n=1 Tax=Streptacidiphilus alkalitolerans TaxID=3342712 RepID=A0ABV6X2J3_9ACTN
MTNPRRRTGRRLALCGASVGVLAAATLAYADTGTSTATRVPAAASSAAHRTATAAPVRTGATGTPGSGPAPARPTAGPSRPAVSTSATPTRPARPAYLGRIGTAVDTATADTATVTPTAAARGSLLVASVLLVGTTSGTPQITDTAGNTYRLSTNQTDATGDTLLIFTALDITPLTASDTITVAFPAANAHAVAIDDYTQLTATDQTASAGGSGTAAASGSTGTTTAATELATAAIADTTGAVSLSGYTALPSLTVGTAKLAMGYRVLTIVGKYRASGPAHSNWIAEILTTR